MSDETALNNKLNELEIRKQSLKQMDKVAKHIIEQVKDDRNKNDELYDFMKDSIEIESDKNPATRDAMAKAMELKMKGTDQLIELLKIKAKLINPNKGALVEISLGDFDSKKGGDTNDMISVAEKLKESIKNGD